MFCSNNLDVYKRQVPHFGQTLMMLDCDPLNNGLGVLLHNTGTEVVNLYDTRSMRNCAIRCTSGIPRV